MSSDYRAFLQDKVRLAPQAGFTVSLDEVTPEFGEDGSPLLKPHVRALVPWACRGGRRALFLSFGLAKTRLQLEIMRQVLTKQGGPVLIVLPLGVRVDFFKEAKALGLRLKFIRRAEEIEHGHHAEARAEGNGGAAFDPGISPGRRTGERPLRPGDVLGPPRRQDHAALPVERDRHGDGAPVIHLTNYETIREQKLDPNLFLAVSLDEASVLRSYGSKTFQTFLTLFEKVRFKFVATATPSPNRVKELIHYAGFLGVMDTGQALTRFFQRDSEKAGNLTLYPHKVDEFWLWVHSWAIFLQKPSDLGFSDEGYDLPPLTVRWHEVPSDHSAAGADRDGQSLMFKDRAAGLSSEARERRDTLGARISKAAAIVAADPDSHRILWHDLEAEREAIERAIPNVVSVYGAQDLDERERRITGFADGEIRNLAGKPVMLGSGPNFQRHCHKAIFCGVNHKFNDFIQALHRIRRFLQTFPVEIDIIHSESEREVRKDLERKWAEHDAQMLRMGEIVRKYGLDQLPVEAVLSRSIGVERVEASGEAFLIARNDAVDEAARQPENSVDLIVTSVPFANHYEYTAQYEDFGHTDDNAHFWAQMDFLTPELKRILKPGRIAAIHVKDRILFGAVTGAGVPTVSPFHAEAIFHYRRHRLDYMGLIFIDTDVVRENNQTYRLGYSEMLKDASKMGVGSPEFVLLFRKAQSDRSKGFADTRVTKQRETYSLARWQLDASALWRSCGDSLLTSGEIATLSPAALMQLYKERSRSGVYDHEALVALGDDLGLRDRLPKTYAMLAPGSNNPEVWTDVTRMRTLNGEQSQRNREQHLCPLQFDVVDRLIERYSMPGETVYDPFGGLMTVPYRAILKGRRGQASELSDTYFRDGLFYCREAEAKRAVRGLFDVAAAEAEAEPMAEAAE